MQGIYKGKYLIGIYNKPEVAGNDEAVAILDNCAQFARYIGKSVRMATAIAARRLRNRKPDIVIDGRVYELHLIEFSNE